MTHRYMHNLALYGRVGENPELEMVKLLKVVEYV